MNYKLSIYLIIAFIFCACVQENIQDESTGKDVYLARCAACHGDELGGKIGPKLGKDSNAKKMPDNYWIQTITKGKGSMPGQNLTDQEVLLVIDYIRDLQE